MIRTQVYLSQKTHVHLKQLAAQRTQAMAEIVREFIDDGLHNTSADHSGKAALQAITQLNLTGGPKDLSQRLDQYLYGQ